MRIIIYGAGAVGGAVGGLLALSGTPVILIGRPYNVSNAIPESGLKLRTPDGTQIVQLPAVTSPDQIEFGPEDVVFLCVRKVRIRIKPCTTCPLLLKISRFFVSRTGCAMRKLPLGIFPGFTA